MIKHHLWKLIVAVILAATLVVPGVSATSTVFQSPPPANDNFADATQVYEAGYDIWTDVTYATTELPDEPLSRCGQSLQHTIWYRFEPTTDGLVTIGLNGDSYYWSSYPTLAVSAYSGSELMNLAPIECTTWAPYYGNSASMSFQVQAGTIYYLQAGTTEWQSDNQLHLNFQFTLPPANDDFADAAQVSNLPFSTNVNTTAATLESNEPRPSCEYGIGQGTVWYAYTATNDKSLMVGTDTQNPTAIAIYTGTSLSNLTEQECFYFMMDYRRGVFKPTPGTTYYFQEMGYGEISFILDFVPAPTVNLYYYPSDPTVFDNVYFYSNSWDPANIGIQSWTWDFGDGSISTDANPSHRYVKDGDYSVKLTGTTYDGRTASATQTVSVKTHDVTIARFSVPQSAKAGQTRQLVVGLNSKRYAEQVRVELYRSVPGGFVLFGILEQSVPVRPSNRTTDFSFSYTFTKDDATIGKVTFKAVATIVNARDALPADNEAIALPTKVMR